MKITGGEGVLLGGISQQPLDRRDSGTVNFGSNVLVDVMRGIIRRPPVEHILPIQSDISFDAKGMMWEDFEVDGEEFLCMVDTTAPAVRLWSKSGQEWNIIDEGGAVEYLTTADRANIRMAGTNDGMYFLNRERVPKLKPNSNTYGTAGSYVYLVGSQYQRTYSLRIVMEDGLEFESSFQTPVGDQAGDQMKLDTKYIMNELFTGLVPGPEGVLHIRVVDDVMRINSLRNPGEYINIMVSDGDGGNNLKVAHSTVNDVGDLPRFALSTDVFTVRPSTGGTDSEYYLKYVQSNRANPTPPGYSQYETEYSLLVGTSDHSASPDAEFEYGYSALQHPVCGDLRPTIGPDGFTVQEYLVSVDALGDYSVRAVIDGVRDELEVQVFTDVGDAVALRNTADEPTVFTAKGNSTVFTYFESNAGSWITMQIVRVRPVVHFTGYAGRYVETTKTGIPYLLDVTTMPIKMERTDTPLTMRLYRPEWLGRRVGNEENNKVPSFVNAPIVDVGIFQGRLGLLTPQTLVLSRSERELDFWRSSATAVVMSDRIDVTTRVQDVTRFDSMILHDKDLLITALSEQYIVDGSRVQSPSTCALQRSSGYEFDISCKPRGLGSSLAYCTFDGKYTQFREYYTRSDTKLSDSNELSSYVKQLMKGRARAIVVDTTSNLAYVFSADDYRKLWVYTWYKRDTKQTVGAWFEWELPYPVLHGWYRAGRLNLIMQVQKDGLTNVELYGLEANKPSDGGLGYRIYLDGLYSSVADSTGAIPVHGLDPDSVMVVGADGAGYPGMQYEAVNTGEGSVRVDISEAGKPFLVGIPFSSQVQLNKVIPKDQNGETDSSMTLRLRMITLRTATSGPYTVEVRREYGDYWQQTYGTAVGRDAIGTSSMELTDSIDIPVREQSLLVDFSITSDGHLPFNLTGYDWTGQLFGNAQRRYFK